MPSALVVATTVPPVSVPSRLSSRVPLPPAPAVVKPKDGPLKGALRWKGKAEGYIVEVARDAEFVLEVQQVDLDGKRWKPPLLESGTWFWRVTAVDEAGFMGASSKVYAFEVD